MVRTIRLAWFFVVALALAAPAVSPGQDKKETKKTDPGDTKTKGKDKLKQDWIFVISGKLTAVSDKEDAALQITVQFTNKVPEQNVQAQKDLLTQQQQLAQQQQTLARAKTPQERQNALNQIAQTSRTIEQTMAKLITYKDVNIDVKLQEIDATRYRFMTPPTVIDTNTGEFMKLTKEELDKARGTEGYPGFAGDKKGLKVGQMVAVYVWKDSKKPPSANALFGEKGKGPAKKVDDFQDELNNFRYDMIMLVVIQDAPREKK